jgi:hypothetical protein
MIRIKVGKAGATEIFEVHKGLLKFYSGYFQVAISNIEEGRFAESKENMITLDEEVDVFRVFKNWIYTRSLPKHAIGEDPDGITWDRILVKLWCFGDRRHIPLLQNECIDGLLSSQMSSKTFHYDLIPDIYANTIAGSSLRKFIIGEVALSSSIKLFEEGLAHYLCKDSLLDLSKLLMLRLEKVSWKDVVPGGCDWHVHEEGVKCKKVKYDVNHCRSSRTPTDCFTDVLARNSILAFTALRPMLTPDRCLTCASRSWSPSKNCST